VPPPYRSGDLGMAMRRAHKRGVKLAGDVDVLDKAALAEQEARVLETDEGSSDLSMWFRHPRI
jgi:hypothetical protein